jgi:hypothetical protein
MEPGYTRLIQKLCVSIQASMSIGNLVKELLSVLDRYIKGLL